MKLKIDVTQEDIDKGTPEKSNSCPIALALKRQLPEAEEISVDIVSDFMIDEQRYIGDLPKSGEMFIQDFDNHKQVNPFSFEMEFNIPCEYCTSINHDTDECDDYDGDDDYY